MALIKTKREEDEIVGTALHDIQRGEAVWMTCDEADISEEGLRRFGEAMLTPTDAEGKIVMAASRQAGRTFSTLKTILGKKSETVIGMDEGRCMN